MNPVAINAHTLARLVSLASLAVEMKEAADIDDPDDATALEIGLVILEKEMAGRATSRN